MSKTSKGKSSSNKSKNASSKKASAEFDFKSFGPVASSIVLTGMMDGSLTFAEVISPPSESAQSLIIGREQKIDAYLILWQEWPSVFSFTQLKKKGIKQLASDYVELASKFDLPVYVHLLTNELPSTAKLKGGQDKNFHLANFISNQWADYKSSQDFDAWESVWNQIQKASKLDDEAFDDFVAHCLFDFSYVLKTEDLEDAEESSSLENFANKLFKVDSDQNKTWRYSLKELDALHKEPENLKSEKIDDLEVSDASEAEQESEEVIDKEETKEEKQSEQSKLQKGEDGIWSAKGAVDYIDTKLEKDKPSQSEEVESDKESEEPADLESLNKSYDSKHNEIEYVVNEQTDGEGSLDPLDFAPDVKSVKDVRDKKKTLELSSKNFLKIAQLKQKQEGMDEESVKALNDAFDWYFSNANELFESKQYEEAEQDYRNALEKLVQLNEPKPDEELKLLENLGEVYINLERPDLAVELYERAEELKVAASIPIPKYLNALLMAGGNYEERGYIKDAEPYYRKAVEIAGNYLELNDPLVKRANEACLRLTKEKTTLISRFSPGELERLNKDSEAEKAIMHRKPTIKSKEQTDTSSKDIWITKEELQPPLPSKEYSAVKWWLVALIPLAVLSFATVFYLQNLKTPVSATLDSTVSFTTSDQRKTIKLDESGVMTLYSETGNLEGTYRFIDDNFSDYLGLLVGHLRRKNEYASIKHEDKVTVNGVSYYAEDSPEHKIVKYMWRYGKLAQLYRNEHRKYPEDVRVFATSSRMTSTYINPFSTNKEAAEITYANGSNNINLPKMIASGHAWKGQAEARPGLIVCNNFEGSRFFIRGYGRDGKLISSSIPDTGFYIELSYGDNLTLDSLKKFKRHKKMETVKDNVRYIFVRGNTEFKKIIPLLDAFVPTILALIGICLFLLWRYKTKKAQSVKKEVFGFVLTMTVIVLWYLVAFMDT